MAYIESHQSLRNHPKVRKAARALGISKVTLIGHLHMLWWWALDYAQDGDLTDFTAEDIALACEWDGDEKQLVQALLDCRSGDRAGLLERTETGRLLIHDWWEYGGKLIAKRQVDADRQRANRAAARGATPETVVEDIHQTSNGRPSDVAGREDKIREDKIRGEESRQADAAPPAPPCKALIEFAKTKPAKRLEEKDGERVGELVDTYGDDMVVEAIGWCWDHKKGPLLSLAYLDATLSGWLVDGKPGERKNGNGRNGKQPIGNLEGYSVPPGYEHLLSPEEQPAKPPPSEAEQLWQRSLEMLRWQLARAAFGNFDGSRAIDMTSDTLTICASDQRKRETIEARLLPKVEHVVTVAAGRPLAVRFEAGF